MTEEEILKNLELGGKEQEKALYELYKNKAKEFGRFFMSRGVAQMTADDVVQETILKILKQAYSYRGDGTANSWMWQIARNALADSLRSKSRERTENLDDEQWKLAESNESFQVNIEIDASRSAEKCVIRGLQSFEKADPDRAYAIKLVVEGVDGKEIADRIGRTYMATRQYLTQCRQHLAPYIKDCFQLLKA